MILLVVLGLVVAVERETVIVIKLKQESREYAEQFASARGLRLLSEKESAHLPSGVWAFGATSGKRARSMSPELHQDDQVEWHEIQEPRRRFTRFSAPRLSGTRAAASDPLYASQWHLHGNANSLKVEPAWAAGVTGKGVVVAIVDDGVQVRHPDLDVHLPLSHDFNNGRGTDPSPYTTDGHGTSASGVCCARRNNGQCGSGVAPGATLVGLRLIAEPTTDLQESQALSWSGAEIDIYSNSWGPMDDANTLAGPGRLTQMAFARNVLVGRHGKGSIYVWAGGNGRDNQDNCNYDGYANSIYTIAVGAIDHAGLQSWYSESCSALFVVGPSSGSGVGITTTDLTGRNGYAPGQCCNTFGGTSSAAPAVSGAIALMLQQRPDLTWRDVQHVLAKSSILPPLEDQLVVANARGYKHSEHFGFGRIDASRMLDAVMAHTLVPVQKAVTLTQLGAKEPHSGNIRGDEGALMHFTSDTPLSFIEHIQVILSVVHPNRGQLQVTLKSAENANADSHLFEPHTGDRHGNIPTSHPFMTVRHWGEKLEGDARKVAFTLVVQDTIRNTYHGRGHLESAQLIVYGY